MREVELKSVVDDIQLRRSAVEAAGGRLVFAGRLFDMRYDLPDHAMALRDHVLRLRVYENDATRAAHLDWKGETCYEGGFKVREEITTMVVDGEALSEILRRLGFTVTIEIDRQIVQYELGDAVVRFEQYPDMDTLVEVEGPPEAIELAIGKLGLPRDGFTAERLPDFVARFEARTGRMASLSRAELEGDRRYRAEDA
jgi:predicted adenylyl cyclase CyaB